MKTALGPDHEYSLLCKAEWAFSLHKLGENVCAEEILRQVVIDTKRIFGSVHPNTLDFQESLACVLDQRGLLTEARQLLDPTYEAMKRLHGPEHPTTLKCALSLARVLRQEDTGAAMALLRRTHD